MVKVEYPGRLGNNLFQYAYGRILAEGLAFRLDASPIPGFCRTCDVVEGECHERPVISYGFGDCPDIDDLLADRSPRRIVLCSWLQRYSFYRQHAHKLREWFELPSATVAGSRDIAVHLRLGDYLDLGWALDPSYYLGILERESFDRLHVLTDEPDHPYLDVFRRLDPIIPRLEPLDALIYLKNAPKLVLSQSTFGWWGAFLSKAERIYFPLTAGSIWSPGSQADLRVDEPRYTYVDAATLPAGRASRIF